MVLFAITCGRLPFEGADLSGTGRPRDTVMTSRILKGQFKVEERLGLEVKVRIPLLSSTNYNAENVLSIALYTTTVCL